MWSHSYATYKNTIITNIFSWSKIRRLFVHKQDSLITDWTNTWQEFTALPPHYNYPTTMDLGTWPQPLSLLHCNSLPLDLNFSPQQTAQLHHGVRCFIPSTAFLLSLQRSCLAKIKSISHQIFYHLKHSCQL